MTNPFNVEMLSVLKKYPNLAKVMLNPFVDKEQRREALVEFWNQLDDRAFTMYAPTELLQKLKISENTSRQYESSEAQADDMIKKIPRLIQFRDLVIEYMRQYRQKYKLEG